MNKLLLLWQLQHQLRPPLPTTPHPWTDAVLGYLLQYYFSSNSLGTDLFLRQQINKALAELKRGDQLIQSKGVDSLTIFELQTAAQARGVRTSPDRLTSELTQWIHLHVDKQIPSSLLILSRAFSISERILRDEEEALQGNAQSIQATLS